MAVTVKSVNELRLMRESCKIAAETLKVVEKNIVEGIAAKELDKIADAYIRSKNAVPAFKGYNGYPSTLCVSINEEIVHGIPREDKILKAGDIVSIDVGVYKNGFYGDTAATYTVGKVEDARVLLLIETTRKALYEGLKYMVAGKNVYDISFAIQTIAESAGFSVVREYTGHGIGRKLHEEPYVLNYVPDKMLRKNGYILRKGNVFAIEPMLNMGRYETEVLSDKWTVVTRDRKWSAHFEHTVAVGDKKPEILTEV
ncbi:MAG TPA: type I methionyl aminopeptidase [bacterium]|nr:type I methionyl aminopeptidase [bacterium]